jgi:UDP-N-acetyl-2-amino-2-deoxyglucuronate dehydrogenase
MGKLVRFAIIGCGGMGGGHVGSINAIPDTQIVAVCDIIKERAVDRAKIAGKGCKPYTSIANMLKRDDIDVVCICTPSGLHAKHGIMAAKAGKHVITEKPIDVTVKAADALIDTCREMCISQHRFDPDFIKLKEAAAAGTLGQLNFCASHTKWYRSQKYYDNGGWRGTWKLDGGGALMNQSVHYIDMMQWIMGPVEEVKAYTATRSHTIETEDVGAACVKFKSGAIGLIEGNTTAYPGFYTRLDVFGDDGGVIIENDTIKEWKIREEVEAAKAIEEAAKAAAKAAGIEYVPAPKVSDVKEEGPKGAASAAITLGSHATQIQAFAEAVRNNTESPVPPESTRHAMAIICAIYKSVKTGKAEKVLG